jgi:hypothetical protein
MNKEFLSPKTITRGCLCELVVIFREKLTSRTQDLSRQRGAHASITDRYKVPHRAFLLLFGKQCKHRYTEHVGLRVSSNFCHFVRVSSLTPPQ